MVAWPAQTAQFQLFQKPTVFVMSDAPSSSGMTKAGTGAKLEDSNIANYGSKEHKDAKLAAAQSEPAWEGCGQKPGIEMWRIEKFKVVKKEKEDHGKFYNGDSYIVLHTYKPDPAEAKLLYNVHFWLGSKSTQDEMGTAAYKTVELDDLLGDLPVQFREVEGHESDEFLAAHGGKIVIMEGGIDSGFRHVKPEEYTPRLMWIKGTGKKVRVSQVENKIENLNNGDTFLLDNGLDLVVWNGPKAAIAEKLKAREICEEMQADRNGKPKMRVLDGCEDDAVFWPILGGTEKAPAASELKDPTPDKVEVNNRTILYELSDKTGKLVKTKICEKDAKIEMLHSDEVFILDVGLTVYTWIGKGASKAERSKGIQYAMDYLDEAKLPLYTPIIRVIEGHETESFKKYFDDPSKKVKPNFTIKPGTSATNFSVRSGNQSPINEDQDWAIWDMEFKSLVKVGNGIEELKAELKEDGVCFVWVRIKVENVGNAGPGIVNEANLVLHWKGKKSKMMEQVKSNGVKLKVEKACPMHKGTLEVTGVKHLTKEVIFDRWKPGSGSKVIQD
eukprot:g47202.t1